MTNLSVLLSLSRLAQRLFRRLAIVGSVLAVIIPVHAATAGDRSDIPLKNWGGFSIVRDAVYDDLERLVTAGLAERTVLNTKPLSRTEAARIVARVIERIRKDERGTYNERRDLEPVLDRLVEEFSVELASLGVKGVSGVGRAPSVFTFVPVDRAQVRGGYASRDISFINNGGLRFQRGLNSGATFESRAQIGDVLTFYLQPEAHANEEFGAARLASGYGKLTLFNTELLVGRESLWWGPGLYGSLILSNNAPPLDQIRIGAAEPFLLPWVGKWIGPTKVLGFLAELEQRRDHPRAKLGGLRGTIAPFSFLELGLSYANMFDGTDKPRLSLGDYPRVLFDPQASDQKDPANDRFRNNALFAMDGDLRLRNVNQYYLPSRDLRLYGEFGWDDTCCSSSFIPLKEGASWLAGVHFLELFETEGLDARLEYADTSTFSFTHNQFYRGYWTRGEVISHVMGTDGTAFNSRISMRVSPELMVGGGLTRLVIGNTVNGAPVTHERRLSGAFDVSYRFWGAYTLFGQYQLMKTTNRNFSAGDDGWDQVLLLEVTRSFR